MLRNIWQFHYHTKPCPFHLMACSSHVCVQLCKLINHSADCKTHCSIIWMSVYFLYYSFCSLVLFPLVKKYQILASSDTHFCVITIESVNWNSYPQLFSLHVSILIDTFQGRLLLHGLYMTCIRFFGRLLYKVRWPENTI